jgi:type VI secretion system protein VasG
LSVVPYVPLGEEVMRNIVRLQLDRVASRIREHHDVEFQYDDQAVALIVSRCTEVESGGRMIDAILTDTVLPAISREILRRILDAAPLHDVRLSATDGAFTYAFEQAPTGAGECHA